MQIPSFSRDVLEALPPIGAAFKGGFFNGLYVHDGKLKAQISAPKVDGGHHAPIEWGPRQLIQAAFDRVDGALSTDAMAAAGSELAQWARALRIDGRDDWHLPALMQLERIYRMAKPTEDANYCSWGDGENASSWPPTGAYTKQLPARTALELFLPGAPEAFEPIGYWTATQHPDYPSFAFVQNFGNGYQDWLHKDFEFGAVAGRSEVLCSFDYSLLVSLQQMFDVEAA
ncbi:hypothetical protein [Burkholderia sp. BCC1985]|uniref:hypothetical protein n=1 Tax=Burkholderia sp. BCC1985 TaxID=2817442 RepID=UPI002AB21549|nr:hypothetical protein [Burkholderia sp. BCC1985]